MPPPTTPTPQSTGTAAATPTADAAKPRAPKAAAAAATALACVQPLIRVRQIREFTRQPVTNAELDAITEVARWSGSSRNEQPWRFIALRDGPPSVASPSWACRRRAGCRPPQPRLRHRPARRAERELSRAFDDGRAAERILVAANLLGLGGGISRLRPDVRSPIGELLDVPATPLGAHHRGPSATRATRASRRSRSPARPGCPGSRSSSKSAGNRDSPTSRPAGCPCQASCHTGLPASPRGRPGTRRGIREEVTLFAMDGGSCHCHRCGSPLLGDPDDEPDGGVDGLPLCGECVREPRRGGGLRHDGHARRRAGRHHRLVSQAGGTT